MYNSFSTILGAVLLTKPCRTRVGDKEWRNWRAVRLPKILVLTIDDFVSAQALQRSLEQETAERELSLDAASEALRVLVSRVDERPVLRLFPPCALISHAQGSSGVVDNMPFAWRGHTKCLTTRARPSPDLAVWLE